MRDADPPVARSRIIELRAGDTGDAKPHRDAPRDEHLTIGKQSGGVGDQLVMLHEGRILACGTADELDRSEDELVRTFMRSQHSG